MSCRYGPKFYMPCHASDRAERLYHSPFNNSTAQVPAPSQRPTLVLSRTSSSRSSFFFDKEKKMKTAAGEAGFFRLNCIIFSFFRALFILSSKKDSFVCSFFSLVTAGARGVRPHLRTRPEVRGMRMRWATVVGTEGAGGVEPVHGAGLVRARRGGKRRRRRPKGISCGVVALTGCSTWTVDRQEGWSMRRGERDRERRMMELGIRLSARQ